MPQEPAVNDQSSNVYMPIDHIEVAKVAILGVVVGLLIPLLAYMIANYFIEPVFCRTADNFGICSTGGVLASHVSAVIVAIVAVALLANWGVFRPLLIVAAATITMWGLQEYLSPITNASLTEFVAFSAALHGLAYLAFYWLARLKQFPISLILVIIATIAACWAMVA